MLSQGGFISLERTGLPIGHMKRTLFADVPVLIWRRALSNWSLAIERSRAGYLAEWFRKA
jgi:heterotetrameric sarcosine oxidase gamma subunit